MLFKSLHQQISTISYVKTHGESIIYPLGLSFLNWEMQGQNTGFCRWDTIEI